MSKEEVTQVVAEVLSTLSSYSQRRIIELMEYSDDTYLQLIALISVDNKDMLAYKLSAKFDRLDQQVLYDKLFAVIKTVEALIDYVYDATVEDQISA